MRRFYPRPRFRIAADGLVGLIVSENEENVRRLCGECRHGQAQQSKQEADGIHGEMVAWPGVCPSNETPGVREVLSQQPPRSTGSFREALASPCRTVSNRPWPNNPLPKKQKR